MYTFNVQDSYPGYFPGHWEISIKDDGSFSAVHVVKVTERREFRAVDKNALYEQYLELQNNEDDNEVIRSEHWQLIVAINGGNAERAKQDFAKYKKDRVNV